MTYNAEIEPDYEKLTLNMKFVFQDRKTLDDFLEGFSAWINSHTENMEIRLEFE